jgi:hypothetical protein
VRTVEYWDIERRRYSGHIEDTLDVIMADDPLYSPNAKPPPSQNTTAGEVQWTLTKDGRRFTCKLRSHGKYGWECQFLEGEEFVAGRRFPMRAQALEWANLEREEHENEGWTLLS